MRMNRSMAFAASMVLGAAMAQAAPMEPSAPESEPGSTKYNPRRRSGSTPVPGGGAKERARRLARMTCNECGEHIGHCECHVTPA